MFSNIFKPKISPRFCCEICDYSTCKKSNINTHYLSAKHLKATECNKNSAVLSPKHKCEICEKTYNDRTGLWRHKKKCVAKNVQDAQVFDKETILMILQQNEEFKDVIMEQSKQIMELAKNNNSITNINNTTNNNSFNLNVFLNEQCKDALNIMDFVNSLNYQLSDLENTAKVGYVKGISDIFLRNLKELDVHKRPIHCSDLKREVLYVKNNDVWEKDEDNVNVKKAIRYISGNNFNQIKKWTEVNPEAKDVRTKKHEQYVKILTNCTGGIDAEEDEKYYNKIISNVAKEVQIDKKL